MMRMMILLTIVRLMMFLFPKSMTLGMVDFMLIKENFDSKWEMNPKKWI